MTGLYEQFAGYHDLELIDLSYYADRADPADVVIGRARTQRSQVIKQADVVALVGLLPEEFPGALSETNFRHYEPRCAHGSSLSAAMHALVAARLGDSELALRYLRETASLDLDPDPNTAGGVRIAGLGGMWQAVKSNRVPVSESYLGCSGIVKRRALRVEASYEPSVAEAFGNLRSSPKTSVIKKAGRFNPCDQIRDIETYLLQFGGDLAPRCCPEFCLRPLHPRLLLSKASTDRGIRTPTSVSNASTQPACVQPLDQPKEHPLPRVPRQ